MKVVPGLISVIMSNFNTPEEYLRTAIESVLTQTYENFEFIIVDDCSTDNSLTIIESYTDSRIILLKNEVNMGITKSLNRGLDFAKGEYIARMDADDICLPERFAKQIDFLKNNPQVIVCGTGVELFGDGAHVYKQKTVCKDIPTREIFRINLLFGNHTNIIHPTAMFRHSALVENHIKYDEKYRYAQDYKMWVDCSRVGECANVSEILFKYRIHNKAVSSGKKDAQKECAKNIMSEQLLWLNLKLPERWEEIHEGFFTGRKEYDLHCRKWIKTIISQNRKFKIYNQNCLKAALWGKWAETTYFALATEKNSVKTVKILMNLPLKCWVTLFEIRKNRSKKD